MRPRIIITSGDINGIGLRCLAVALQHRTFDADLQLAIGHDTLRSCIAVYDLPGTLALDRWHIADNVVHLHDVFVAALPTPGQAQDDASRLAVASLDHAIACVRSGDADAMVTLPINKHALTRVGWRFPGQTEMVAAGVGGTPLMVLCTQSVRVALATVHVPLRNVVQTLTTDLIVDRIAQLAQHLRIDRGITHPRIAVLAIDPHAGDNGTIGTDDQALVVPAIARARSVGHDAHGPMPADGFFAFGAYRSFDGILAMYHDQGLIPLKLLAKGAGSNVTAGLAVVRTSPDHGTAYDRAAGGTVEADSTIESIDIAIDIVRRRGSL